MPRGDRTGPAGLGPMTGRAAGYCTGALTPGFMNRSPGAGSWRMGRGGGPRGGGGGRGWRHQYYATGLPGWMRAGRGFGPCGAYGFPYDAPITREQEVESLREQAKYLADTLETINSRLDELTAKEA